MGTRSTGRTAHQFQTGSSVCACASVQTRRPFSAPSPSQRHSATRQPLLVELTLALSTSTRQCSSSLSSSSQAQTATPLLAVRLLRRSEAAEAAQTTLSFRPAERPLRKAFMRETSLWRKTTLRESSFF